MTKDEQLAFARKEILDRITSWEDLYEFFASVMRDVSASGHPGTAFNALYTMYSFMYAMRELPEEGDIKKIGERMIHILVYESKEKLGAEVTVMTAAEVEEALRTTATRIAAAVAMSAPDVSGKPKTFH